VRGDNNQEIGNQKKGAAKMSSKSEANIALLATLFPAVFSSEPWQPHRPLKVGIGDDLVARGLLSAPEVNAALKGYVNRLMYQKCLAAGGTRIDLDGNGAGEVSSEHRCHAERLIARVKARQLAETPAAKAEADSERAVRPAAMPPLAAKPKAIAIPPPVQTTPPTGSGRLGLADLKRAARERRARQEAVAPVRL
jgi:sRNA-binding protein